MCLSTVYKNSLTDLMERQVAIEGTLEMANLVDGLAIVKEAAV